ncbi:Blp family class II bacteriocin [Streptococcus agalactiae]|uniref:Blp family class II bacteriocin n=1 Tax=Streptococcus agalactiae TaxID=1311 RepID=UPI003C776843
MNITMEQFEIMNEATLSSVEGGGRVSAGEIGQAFGICTLAGGVIGSVIPIVGSFGGAILGAQYCTGAWAIIRTH